MRIVLDIALNDLRIFFSQRGNLISLVLIPIALTLVLGTAFSGFATSDSQPIIIVDVIDNDNTDASGEFLENLRNVGTLSLRVCMTGDSTEECALQDGTLDVELMRSRVENGTAEAGIVIPQGYENSFETFEPVNIEYYSIADVTTGDVVMPALQTILYRVNGASVASQMAVLVGENFSESGSIFRDEQDRDDFSQTAYETANELWDRDLISTDFILIQSGETETSSVSTVQAGFGQSIPGMGSMYVLFTVLGGMAVLIRERKQWTLQRLVVLPIWRGQIIGGKILGYFIMGMIQFLVVFAIAIVIQLNLGADLVALLLVMAAFTLCSTALAIALSTFLKNEEQAGSLSIFLGLVLAAIGGAWWPLQIVPDFMQVIGHLSPVAWAMDAFNELLFFNGSVVDVLPEIGVLLLASAVMFGIGIWRFRYE